MTFCRKICQCALFVACTFLVGCRSANWTRHACEIFLESPYGGNSQIVTLPASGLRVCIAPVPVFTEKDMSSIAVIKCACGCALAVTLTDRAAYEMYNLSVDILGRKLLFGYDGIAIGFSIIDCIFGGRELLFVPEIPDEMCYDLFCPGKR
jgi:hypothetical protein